jgi:uncharacterized repeat protein (TIGR03803 family)
VTTFCDRSLGLRLHLANGGRTETGLIAKLWVRFWHEILWRCFAICNLRTRRHLEVQKGTESSNPACSATQSELQRNFPVLRDEICERRPFFAIVPQQTGVQRIDRSAENGVTVPFAPVGFIFDGAGNLYGVSTSSGTYQSGTLVELSPETGATWSAALLHTFGKGKDGVEPLGTLLYLDGNLYGSTSLGGQYGFGTVFEVTP